MLCSYFALAVNSANADDFTHTVSLDQRSGGTSYVNATIGTSITVPFLVDTGSSMVVINKETYKLLKKSHEIAKSGAAAARLANGKIQRVSLYTVSEFTIGSECQLGEVEVAVIPKGNNILGMSVLTRTAPFAFQVSPPSLILSHCNTTTIASR